MNTTIRSLAFVALALLGLQAPAAEEGRIYTPGPFDRLNVSGAARIELVQGPQDQVFVVGDEAAQRVVNLEVRNGRLNIRTEEGWKFWNRDAVQLRIQLRELSQLVISGASEIQAPKSIRADDLRISIAGQGSVRIGELVANRLRFDIAGAGDGELAGRVNDLQLRVSGKGKLLAEKLKAARAMVAISGIGQADVWATDDLHIQVSGIGTINYWGQPRVTRSLSGMSDVNAKGDKR